MLTYNMIKTLCKEKGVTVTGTEHTLGFARGSLCKIDTSKPSMEKVQKLAEYFNVSVEYLMTGGGTDKNESILTKRDERDIEKIIEATRQQLISQDGLMFDGKPASPEAIDSIISAMRVGMEMAKEKNKERYTPQKYKKK